VRHHASRGIIHRAVSSIARYHPSRGIIIARHRASRGITHCAASRIARHYASRGIIIAQHHHRAATSITRHNPLTNNKLLYTGTTRRSRIQAHA
jgi:hypothetical protein